MATVINRLFKWMVCSSTLLIIISGASFAASSLAASADKFISYTDDGKGPALILIHAFPTDKRLWLPQRAGLKQTFRVITLDLWGFGQSADVDGQAVTMSDYADEVKQLLDQLDIGQAIIGGESMGGYVALAMLEKYPNRVAGLILSDTQSIADNEEAKAKREATAVNVLNQGTSQLIDGFMPKALTPEAPESMRQSLRSILESQPAVAAASALRGMALRVDTSMLLSGTTLPILIITGDQDALILPLQSHRMHELAKNSQLVVIPGAAHLSNLEKAEEWNKAVLGVFAR